MIWDVIIVGSGPAGHTAGIYLGRAGLRVLMFEGFMAGGVPAGGQLTQTEIVENYSGFSQGILGSTLMEEMRKQSLKMSVDIQTQTVKKIDMSERPFNVFLESGESFKAKTLILATGASAKRMNLIAEEIYWQKGISACAVCDGALPIYRDAPLAVVGGGDTACEEALYLTRYAQKVYMLLRRDQFRASYIMQKRVNENSKIEILYNSLPIEALGDGKFLTGIKIKNTLSEEISEITVKGLFYAIGHTPNTQFLEGQLLTNETGYVISQNENGVSTNIEGIFVSGDMVDPRYRQAIVAAGSGCKAAMEAIWFLQKEES